MHIPLKSLVAAAAFALPALALAAAPNLVVNGNFSGDNSDFTSGYTYSPGGNGAEGQYTVRSNPSPWNPFFVSIGDHTSGDGLMFVGNGSPVSGALVWMSGPIAVTADTNYFFEAYVANVCCTPGYGGANSPALLEFSIATPALVSLGTADTSIANPGTWQGIGKTWYSGSATSVTLSLINRNTAVGGNDFAVDDVYFGTESTIVPEPQTYALFLLGLGALAGVVRRRSRQA